MNGVLTSEDRRTRLAIALCFLMPGALFGLVMSRLPALAAQAFFDTSDVALLLFFSGCVCFISLFTAAPIMRHFGSVKVIYVSIPLSIIFLVMLGFATRPLFIYADIIVVSFTMSLVDVAANAQGMRFELKTGKSSMSLFHGFYGTGAILASLSAALFAHWHIGPGPNFLTTMAVIGALTLFNIGALLQDEPAAADVTASAKSSTQNPKSSIRTLYLIGIMALLMYCAEGVVSDWGSLYMVTVKGAEESIAAMVYGVFSFVSVSMRFMGDRLRNRLGNLRILCWSGFVAAFGMAIVFMTSSPFAALAGYAITGLGLSLTVPILFSMAGQTPGIDPETASTRVSLCAYTGLFFFPPFVGFVSQICELEIALLSIFPMLVLFFIGFLWLRIRVRSFS